MVRRGASQLVLVLATILAAVLLASGLAVAATIEGDDAANTITGTDGADKINGKDGNDTISGMGGADAIEGGKGNDKLFGTDEYQSGLADGSQTSVDGKDVVKGENGDDTVVGASGEDELHGGDGADTIIEGPVNDTAEDRIYGDGGNDQITTLSEPASKDHVDCGGGTDMVEADPLDSVNANCEDVEVIDEMQEQPTTNAPSSEAEALPPAVISTEGDVEGDEQPAPSAGSQEPSEEMAAQASYYVDFNCRARAAYRGSKLCAVVNPDTIDEVGVGVYNTYPTRWLWVTIWQGTNYIKGHHLHEFDDPYDYFYTSGFGFPAGIYARTSCWSACNRSTWYEGYFTVT
jgi:Ca2+-binding RTX toxin-like protein